MPNKKEEQKKEKTDIFDNNSSGEDKLRAFVLKPILKSESVSSHRSFAMLEEAVGLAQAINLMVCVAEILNIARPAPSTLLGKGLVESWADLVKESDIDLVIVDHVLSPIQQRNLEKAWHCKVIDRTGLILEIFGDRARTKEGQLQVELAALNYQKSRLVRSWTHLERQRGGFGFMGGPGESQLEIDRRLITKRIIKLKKDLEQVRRTRGLQREARQRAEHPTVALVGYTNAGKSTLFNRLTGADVMAKDMLFATLDPSMRGVKLPSGHEVIFSDTVGFISELPTHLVEAFRATLEEVQLADIILHVRDVTHPETRLQKEAVEDILFDLGIEDDDVRLVEVLNKVDLLEEGERNNLHDYTQRQSWDDRNALQVEGHKQGSRGGAVTVSALTGEGVSDLLHLIEEHISARSKIFEITLALSEGAAIAWLYGHGKLIDRKDKKTKTVIKVALDQASYGRYLNMFGKVSNVKY